MKKLHLICNAHIDPVWMWQWEEGLSSVLSTFRSACDLLEEFDYIFCHNEALIYQWVEEYDPELFERIKVKVREGKWRIMGGWYLQPDCNMPCGESLVRQALVGKKYFLDKFGVDITTAINFDPFGHTIGLAQILKKCGFDSYMCCRPNVAQFPGDDSFVWKGLDDSEIKVCRVSSNYNSAMGKVTEKINAVIQNSKADIDVVLWGVGNHGGGPSRKDLQDIAELSANSDIKIIHSTPEQFFEDFSATKVVSCGLNSCMPGCYTSLNRIKTLHRQLENELYMTEKMLTHASLCGLTYPHDEMNNAIKTLLYSEFHDILPGSSVPKAEDDAIRLINFGLEIINRLRARAFFWLMKGEQKAKPKEFPIMVYNPQPYRVNTIVEIGFNLEDQNWDNTFTNIVVYSGEKRLKTQVVKEDSNITLDWMKKIVFECVLEPMSINRFDCKKEILSSAPLHAEINGDFIFDNGIYKAGISGATGMLNSLVIGEKKYIDKDLSVDVYGSNPDPWGMNDAQLSRLGEFEASFESMTREESGCYSGLDKPLACTRIIEDGEVKTSVETVLKYNNSACRVKYDFYKTCAEIDCEIIMQFNERNKLVKLHLPTSFSGDTIAQIAYGREKLSDIGNEQVMQKWVCKQSDKQCFAIINNSIYGLSATKNSLDITLVRSTAYSCHPLPDRPLLVEDRYHRGTDLGERAYQLKFVFGESDMLDTLDFRAQLYNEKPFALNVFPSGEGDKVAQNIISLDNEKITLTTAKQSDDGVYIIRLFNNTNGAQHCSMSILSDMFSLDFGKFEIKTLTYSNGKVTQSAKLLI